jgi:hypothetical protein
MSRSVLAGVTLLAVAMTTSACPSDDPQEVEAVDAEGSTAAGGSEDGFCALMAEVSSDEADPGSAEWVAVYAEATAAAPDQFRSAMEAQLALLEAQQEMEASGTGDDEGDLTGNFEYMELVAATQTAAHQEAAENLAVFLLEECGIELVEPDEGAPATFTSVGRPLDAGTE